MARGGTGSILSHKLIQTHSKDAGATPALSIYKWEFASACAAAFNVIYKDKIISSPYKKNNEIGVQMRKIMNFNEYQSKARDTDKYPVAVGLMEDYNKSNHREMLGMLYTLGLVGEAGEVADKIKKIYRDKQGEFSPEDRMAIAKELGDTLWYVARLSEYLDYTLEQIARLNIDKLSVRAQNNTIHGSGDNR